MTQILVHVPELETEAFLAELKAKGYTYSQDEITDWQKAILDQRIASTNDEDCISWSQLQDDMNASRRK